MRNRDVLPLIRHLQGKTVTGILVESNDQIDIYLSDNTSVNFNTSSNPKWINQYVPSIGVYESDLSYVKTRLPVTIQAITVTSMGRMWIYIIFYLEESGTPITLYFDRSLIKITSH